MFDILDPERLTFLQYFWVCFLAVLLVLAICCWIDLNYQFHML
jgi:hypothetical protein